MQKHEHWRGEAVGLDLRGAGAGYGQAGGRAGSRSDWGGC